VLQINATKNYGNGSTYPSYTALGGHIHGYVNGSGSTYPRYLDIASIGEGDGSKGGEIRFLTSPNGTTTGVERVRINQAGNVGIGVTVPSQKLDVNGAVRAREGLNLGQDTFEGTSSTFTFANGVADQNVDIVLPNASLWGYLEVEVTGFYSNQNALGKLTKRYALGLNVGGTSFSSEARISDAIGPIVDNLHLGPIRWDSGTSTYRIRVAHIVSTGNPFAVKLKAFTSGGRALNLNGVNISSIYTQSTSGLTFQQPHYKTLGIGTPDPVSELDVFNASGGALSLSYTGGSGNGGSIDFNLINAGVSERLTAQIKGIDDGAYRQDISFSGKTSASGSSGMSENMRITAAGLVTKPRTSAGNGAFYAHATSGPTSTAGTQHPVVFTTLAQGGGYSTSTGRYTCPVAGWYSFTTNVRIDNYNSTTGYMRIAFYTGTTATTAQTGYSQGHAIYGAGSYSGNYYSMNTHWQVYLGASTQVGVAVFSNLGTYIRHTESNFTGILLG
jgi:hypothetical protein